MLTFKLVNIRTFPNIGTFQGALSLSLCLQTLFFN
jgi:hypothetical protein